jgi:hypothetical protein
MDIHSLTPDQAAKMYKAIWPALNYLTRLRARMEKKGFPPGDRHFQLVNQASDAVHRLSIELHYLSCKSGVGRTENE